MRVVVGNAFQKGFDTVIPLTKRHCEIAKLFGFEFAVRYFYNLTKTEIDTILDSGLGLKFVHHANSYDFNRVINDLHEYGIPQGATIYHDIENSKLEAKRYNLLFKWFFYTYSK